MADDLQQHAPGGHYSGQNKIPSIGQFIQKLDMDKGRRDKELDEKEKAARAQAGQNKPKADQDGVVAHQNETQKESQSQKTVTDPTTGHQVVIENVNKEYMEAAKNPMVL